MAKSFLKKVLKEKQADVAKMKQKVPFEKLLEKMLTLPPVRNFREAMFNSQRMGVIAEIKRKVPGELSWKPRVQIEKLVQAYVSGGALGISVVTDAKYFGGSIDMVEEIKKICNIPVLRKDFIVDPYQIYESRAARADALLLIAEAIPGKMLSKFIEITGSLGMTPVVEVHELLDVKRVIRAGADVVLLNNRDLNSLKVNLQNVDRLSKGMPKDILVIAASGYENPEDVCKIVSERVRAVLIGRALVSHKEPDRLIKQIIEATAKL